ncbi:MAG: hypothetical protein ABSH36_01230, partial [Solirubrobacteraceae bacterium]
MGPSLHIWRSILVGRPDCEAFQPEPGHRARHKREHDKEQGNYKQLEAPGWPLESFEGGHRLALRMLLAFSVRFGFDVPYRFLARLSHTVRLPFFLSCLHSLNALASCSTLSAVVVLTFTAAAGADIDGRFPAAANVALAGAPNTAGCGVGGGLHESPLSHGGGDTDTGNPPSTLASHTTT